MRFRLIDGCPCPASVAPYVSLVLKRAGQGAASIYRGEDARALLHANGKMTQTEIHKAYPTISNPAGFSEHELRSDGVDGSGVQRGGRLPEWMVGVDSGTNDDAAKQRVTEAAAHYGWRIVHPYSRGVEGHHWRFSVEPKPNRLADRARIMALRAGMPGAPKRPPRKPRPRLRPVRTVSGRGVQFVAGFEGFRSAPYKDAVGVWTIGYGETKGITANTRPWSEAKARRQLRRRLNRDYAPAVAALELPLTQAMFDALASFVYNLGPAAIAPSTGIGRMLRVRAWEKAADEILKWDKAGGRALPGLTRRRQAERTLFLSDLPKRK